VFHLTTCKQKVVSPAFIHNQRNPSKGKVVFVVILTKKVLKSADE
jgi:hypothetical protein